MNTENTKQSVDQSEIETVGLGFYFEDFFEGRNFKTVGRTITETDITTFINTVGLTEGLFTNLEYLKHESLLQGRVSPGSLVFSFAEGLLIQGTLQKTGLAFIEANVKVLMPTVAGDTISVFCKVTEARRSKSRPNTGLVRTENEVRRQDGQVVMTYNPLRMVKCRT